MIYIFARLVASSNPFNGNDQNWILNEQMRIPINRRHHLNTHLWRATFAKGFTSVISNAKMTNMFGDLSSFSCKLRFEKLLIV